MKKFILLFCFLFISGYAHSQFYMEDFIYSSGTLITTTGNWNAASAGGTNPIAVISPGLEFPDYLGSGIGNAVFLNTSGEDDSSRMIPRQDSGGTFAVYTSFMIRVHTAQGIGDYCFALSTTGNAFDARVYVRPNTGVGLGFNFGITKANEATVNYGTGIYEFGTTYLIVTKYQFNSGLLTDSVSLFVFDSTQTVPNTEPSPTIGPIGASSADAINLSRVILRQGSSTNAPTVTIDGIYIDNTWNAGILPVELASFTASINRRDVTLQWATNSETNNRGFDVERSPVNGSWEKIGFMTGNGTTTGSHNYTFTDKNLNIGVYNYRLKQIDFNGNYEYFNLGNEVNISSPEKYDLSQNYPNPFNPSTKINFDIPVDGKVSLKVYDAGGREVADLVNDYRNAGYHSVNFNASNLSTGVYFYTLTAGDFVSVKKMLLIK